MRQRGFTLVEVMLALGILFAGLAMLIRSTSGSIRTAQYAEMIGVTTELARGKMYDLEEELLRDGFQELEQDEQGDFSDEGWPQVTWEARIVKVELPNLHALDALGEGGEDAEDGGGALFPGMGGMGPAGGGAGGAFMESQFEMVRQILESSIRRVELTVRWKVAGTEEELLVVAYFTDPAAIGRIIGGLPAGGGDPQEGARGGGGTSGQGGAGGRGGQGGPTGGRGGPSR